MSRIPNTMIRASAGSGKTFQLTNRFIRLLLRGDAPERIIALTFTRKAAGEFFEGILTKLAKAATNEAEAKRLARGVGHQQAGPPAVCAALRKLVDNLGRLSLGTIDSFFRRVLGLFSFEFGLGGQFEMMNEFDKEQARLAVLEYLLANQQVKLAEQDDLIKSYQLASAGKDNRNFVGSFVEHLENCHELLLRVPGADRWGDPDRIWPGGNPWVREQAELPVLVADWRQHIEEHTVFTNEVHRNWNSLADYLRQWAPGKELFKKTPKLITQAVEGLDDMKRGKWVFENRNKAYSTSADFSHKLARVLHYCIAWELELKLERTRGIFRLLKTFEENYDAQVRRTGRLMFDDLPLLLAPVEGQVLLGGKGPNRLDLEYRLDGEFDHWLLDEFQDTSTVQWRAVANLIDEVVQDPSGERTFFCVGDQKQSIYQWRGGDPQLFDRVADFYSKGQGDEFEVKSLDVSWRSCPDVLKMVNKVFGENEKLASFDESRSAASRWMEIWEKHKSADDRAGEKGHSLHLSVDDADDRWPVVAQLLKRLQPIANRLECAILVQTNKIARELVNHLRGAGLGIPIVGESATNPGADNPLGMALLSLFRAAAHPEDRFSAGHIQLTPLANHLPEDPSKWQAALRDIQRDIYQQGFEPVARVWINLLDPELDDFAHWRAPQFLELARQFDQSGSRDIDAFLRFIPAQEITEASGASVVQVMTIHKAKGLTFDLTIVPDLEGKRLDQARNETLHTQRKNDGETDWILSLPSKDICAQDEPLKDAVAEARSEACYESFCKLYVALTRSSHGLYVITSKPSGNSQNYAKLLSDTLDADKKSKTYTEKLARTTAMFESATAMFESGDFDWMKTKKKITETPEMKFKPVATGHRHLRLPRRRPSTHGETVLSAAKLFEPRESDAASFGRAVHGIFEEIKWHDENTVARLEAHREKSPDALAEVERCLAVEEVAQLFAPNPDAEVWLERAFELVLDGEFCSGVFDRVVLHDGSAQIIDFKTDHVEADTIDDAVKRHQPQLALYRRVLARLTGLAKKAITCQLVFTRPARVMEA
jgi:ATP-dependent exoDNAse (exonuclease V) beta subunit